MVHKLARKTVDPILLRGIEDGLLRLGTQISGQRFTDIDTMWQQLADRDRRLCGRLYNGAKLLPELHTLVPVLEELVISEFSFSQPALVDINFRIDAPNEDEFLFSWHQDYWFSICSPSAVVAWIPLTGTDPDIGGVELLDPPVGRIMRAAPNASASYSDSLVLDEPIPDGRFFAPDVNRGDVLLFTFDELHRSLPNRSSGRCRWTLQFRWADFGEAQFQEEDYKPGLVHPGHSTYWERIRNAQ